MEKTTCQICGRSIKSSSGVIAHHGYKRPGDGWQTASCFGARHLPYEISCDAIPQAIEKVRKFITSQSNRLLNFIANPPETLTINKRYPQRGTEEVSRPINFDPDKDHCYSMRQVYELAYQREKYQIETSIKHAKNDLAYLLDRLSSWTPKTTLEDQANIDFGIPTK
jgi:hypothetical protein